MTFTGHIENGMIVPDLPLSLPEGTAVTFSLLPPTRNQETVARPLSERLADVIGTVDNLPEDAAQNLKHYLYGLPKR